MKDRNIILTFFPVTRASLFSNIFRLRGNGSLQSIEQNNAAAVWVGKMRLILGVMCFVGLVSAWSG